MAAPDPGEIESYGLTIRKRNADTIPFYEAGRYFPKALFARVRLIPAVHHTEQDGGRGFSRLATVDVYAAERGGNKRAIRGVVDADHRKTPRDFHVVLPRRGDEPHCLQIIVGNYRSGTGLLHELPERLLTGLESRVLARKTFQRHVLPFAHVE